MKNKKTIILVCFILIGIVGTIVDFTQKPKETLSINKDVKPKTEIKIDVPKSKITQEETTELIQAFNNLFSNNIYKTIYEGVEFKNNMLYVYINNYWYILSVNEKKEMIDTIKMSFMGMTKARSIDFSIDNLNIRIKDNNKVIAKWGSLAGYRLD